MDPCDRYGAYISADAQVFKFFKGLAFSGAWCCFDGLNGMYLEVLSVIAQQLLVLFRRTADMKYYNYTATLVFEGTPAQATMKLTFNVSITLNGYAGRAELPDNLTAWSCSVAMIALDYASLELNMFYAYSFADVQVLKFFK
eukprot:3507171-Amphidinium_carterae.1